MFFPVLVSASILVPAFAINLQGAVIKDAGVRRFVGGENYGFNNDYQLNLPPVNSNKADVMAACAAHAVQHGYPAFEAYRSRIDDLSVPEDKRYRTSCYFNLGIRSIFGPLGDFTILPLKTTAFNCTDQSNGCTERRDFVALGDDLSAVDQPDDTIIPEKSYFQMAAEYMPVALGSRKTIEDCLAMYTSHNSKASRGQLVTYIEFSTDQDTCIGKRSVGSVTRALHRDVGIVLPGSSHFMQYPMDQFKAELNNVTCTRADIRTDVSVDRITFHACELFDYSTDLNIRPKPRFMEGTFQPPVQILIGFRESSVRQRFKLLAQTKAFVLNTADFEDHEISDVYQAKDGYAATGQCGQRATSKGHKSYNVFYLQGQGWRCLSVKQNITDPSHLSIVDENAIWSYLYIAT